MSIRDIGTNLHSYVDELIDAVSGKSSDADCQAAMKRFLQSTHHSLGSLSWYLGADGEVFSREAVPASDLVDDAFFEVNREREFEPAPRRRQYSAVAVGASL